MQQNKKKENSVNLAEKKKSYTREEKNNKGNSSVKKEIKEENSNKKIIIIALVLALLIAGLSYWRISINNAEKEKNKDNEQKEEVKQEDKEEIDDEESESESESYYYDYTYEVKPVVDEKDDSEVEEVVPEVEELYYSLTFESNGGSSVETQILGVNEVTETPTSFPTREGWIFAGWFTDDTFSETYIFGTHLTEDITIYAKWVKHIKYVHEGEELEDIAVVGLNEEIPLLSSEDAGIILGEDEELGWFISNEDEYGNISIVEILPGTVLDEKIVEEFDEEIVLESDILAIFDMNFNYSVEIQSTESEVPSQIKDEVITKEVIQGRALPFDEVATEIKTNYPEFEGKDFGWYYIEGNVMFDLPSDAVADPAITEVHMGEVVTITYVEKVYDNELEQEVEKETVQNIVKDSHIAEDNILIPEEQEGKEFVGWFPVIDEQENLGEDKLTSDTIIDEDKTFIAKWEDIVDETLEEDAIIENVIDESEDTEEQNEGSNNEGTDLQNLEELPAEETVVENTEPLQEITNEEEGV